MRGYECRVKHMLGDPAKLWNTATVELSRLYSHHFHYHLMIRNYRSMVSWYHRIADLQMMRQLLRCRTQSCGHSFPSAFIVIFTNNWSVFSLYMPHLVSESTLCFSPTASCRSLHLGLWSSYTYHFSSFHKFTTLIIHMITPSLFHSQLKTYLFHKSFPP